LKKALISLIITIFSSLLFLYLINELSVWDQAYIDNYIDQYSIDTNTEFNDFLEEARNQGVILDFLNKRNIIIIHVVGIVAATALLSTIYLIINKLFFKKYFESPDHVEAIRRSLWIPITIAFLNFLRLLGSFNMIYFIIIIIFFLLIVLIEFTFISDNKDINTE
jgi:hypothetical protein